ncbi:MAG TPA: hypothetical protein PLR44_09675 [Thermomicrobiales bacterium]|nr:hypothetical protein [Thermomicrobiales bacterium]HRA31068.1 hypothetical protein [Thermomicrobiales bacterium]
MSERSPRLLDKPSIPPRKPENRKQRWGIVVAWLFANFTRVTPIRVGYLLSDRVGDLLYWRTRVYRLSVIDNLRHVYRGQISEMALRRQARRVFRTSARNFWDLGRLPHMAPEEFSRIVRLPEHDWSLIESIRDEGTGGIILTGHFGAFDFASQTLFTRGYNPYVLTAPTVGEFVYAAVSWLRRGQDAPLEDVSPAAIRRMMRVLRGGGFVGLVADRDFADSGQLVELFDELTTLPVGAVRLSRATGAPIIPVFAVRDDATGRAQRYAFFISDPFTVERTADEEADVAVGLRKMAAVLERYIAMFPEQWVMFHRVWPEGARRRRLIDTIREATAERLASATGPDDQPVSVAGPAEDQR